MTPKPIITLQKGQHHDKQVVWFRVAYVGGLVVAVKSLSGACWSNGEMAWYQPANLFDLKNPIDGILEDG